MTDVRLTCINPEDGSIVPVAGTAKGELKLEEPIEFDGNLDGDLTVSGSSTFSDQVIIGGYDSALNTSNGVLLGAVGGVFSQLPSSQPNGVVLQGMLGTTPTTQILGSGQAAFKGGISTGRKAGFTAEGYLWCTTRRGDTVILDATSNGLGTWADYTPPPSLKDKLETLRDESNTISQDLPET